jgi:hypothetical protein
LLNVLFYRYNDSVIRINTDHADAHLAFSSHPSPSNLIQNQMPHIAWGVQYVSKTPYANPTQYVCTCISIAEVRDLKFADDGRRQRCNRLLPLAELRRERRRAPHTSLATTKRRFVRTAGDGPSPSCLSSSCAVVHTHIVVCIDSCRRGATATERRRDTSLSRYHKGRCACRHMITCELPCDQQLPLSHHRQSSSFGSLCCPCFGGLLLFPSPTFPRRFHRERGRRGPVLDGKGPSHSEGTPSIVVFQYFQWYYCRFVRLASRFAGVRRVASRVAFPHVRALINLILILSKL